MNKYNFYRVKIKIIGALLLVSILLLSPLVAASALNNSVLKTQTVNEGNRYQGQLRVYIVEKESRWKMQNRQHYQYALYDFAYDDPVSIRYQETYEQSINWKGDVSENNVIVMAALFNSEGHTSYAVPPNERPFTAHYVDAAAAATPGETGFNTRNEEYTHTVFVEEGTATTCPYCPIMAKELHQIYESGEYPFYYVAMVVDKSSDASRRMNQCNLYYVPTAIYDGGDVVAVGGGLGVDYHKNIIESIGKRDVHELNLTLSVEWRGDGELDIDISITNIEELPNAPPGVPTITGPSTGKKNTEQTFQISTEDPDDDEVFYFIDWGDETDSGWIGPYASGETITAAHTWSEKGAYLVRVKAKDEFDVETDWTTLELTIPKTRTYDGLSLIECIQHIIMHFLPHLQF
jgi:hypothetical protein